MTFFDRELRPQVELLPKERCIRLMLAWLDRATRSHVPDALLRANLNDFAERLRRLPPFISHEQLLNAEFAVEAIAAECQPDDEEDPDERFVHALAAVIGLALRIRAALEPREDMVSILRDTSALGVMSAAFADKDTKPRSARRRMRCVRSRGGYEQTRDFCANSSARRLLVCERGAGSVSRGGRGRERRSRTTWRVSQCPARAATRPGVS